MRYQIFSTLFFSMLANTVLVNFLFVGNAGAAERFYFETDVTRTEIKSDNGKYTMPYNGKFKAGFYVRKQIALELQYALKGSKDENNSNLELKNLYGGYLRLDSELHNRVRIYLLGGYTQADIGVTGSYTKENKGGGISWGIGIEDQVVRLRNTYFTLDYMKYYNEGGFNISGYSVGFRYLF